MYRKIEREFVLRDPLLNLWAGIREDVLQYFEGNQVVWWGDQGNQPTGHLLSSQIACLNHLYFLRQRKDAASAILKAIHPKIIEAVIVDDGFVEFEAIGRKNYLGERLHTRGAHATSVDAIMVGKKADGKNVLVLIEWKYTESYPTKDKYIPARAKTYDPLLAEPDCPIKVKSFEWLYFEPFYQLMRQTLLGWKMIQHEEYQCNEFIHVHIIPAKNHNLKGRVTSPKLKGESMSEAWQGVLQEPSRYQVISPEAFLAPIAVCKDTGSIISYLEKRYWDH
jgi:hypothetical protein